MVLAGSINKQIVGTINAQGGRAIGLCGKDGNMVIARKVSRAGAAAATSRTSSISASSASPTRSTPPCWSRFSAAN